MMLPSISIHSYFLAFSLSHGVKKKIKWSRGANVWIFFSFIILISFRLWHAVPLGRRGMSVLNVPQLSAHPCRHSTGRPPSGPQALPLICPHGTWTHTSETAPHTTKSTTTTSTSTTTIATTTTKVGLKVKRKVRKQNSTRIPVDTLPACGTVSNVVPQLLLL